MAIAILVGDDQQPVHADWSGLCAQGLEIVSFGFNKKPGSMD